MSGPLARDGPDITTRKLSSREHQEMKCRNCPTAAVPALHEVALLISGFPVRSFVRPEVPEPPEHGTSLRTALQQSRPQLVRAAAPT